MAETAGSVDRAPSRSGVRLAELVGTLSLAIDLGLGQPMEHVARSCLLSTRLGEQIGLDTHDRAAAYYVALLGWVGCIANSQAAAQRFGDDVAYRAGVYDVDMSPLPFLGYLLRSADPESSPARRLSVRAALVASGARAVQASIHDDCQTTRGIAARLGLDEAVCGPLGQIFARWDGKGIPARLGGNEIGMSVRLWQLCDVAEVHHRRGGTDAAIQMARERSGSQFDPDLVDIFCASAEELFEALADASSWDDLIAAEPGLHDELTNAELDKALEVLADYADLKSPRLRGHSRSVADLAAAAAARMGLSAGDAHTLRRAALVHDLGRTGVPNTILEKVGPLTTAEGERLRLHSYYTERMLQHPAALREVGAIAALAHERLDGSGYHRGLSAPAIPMAARILAAANEYHASLEARSAPRSAKEAARRLNDEARAGRLDPGAVDAVLACSGNRPQHRPTGPAGLTPREIEVLVLLARGASNRQIARQLGITPKTAGNHIERIYAKAQVGTRAAASMFAMQHGLLNRLDPID